MSFYLKAIVQIDVHYSLPREEEKRRAANSDKNQGSLLVRVLGSTQPFSEYTLRNKCASFGDIKDISPAGREYVHTHARVNGMSDY